MSFFTVYVILYVNNASTNVTSDRATAVAYVTPYW